MCLAIPMRILSVDPDGSGQLEFDGNTARVNLSLVTDPRPGDYVIVHAGFAIEKLDAAEADQRLRLFAELAAGWQAGQP